MATYLMNALPNSFLPSEGETVTLSGISIEEAVLICTAENLYEEYDDNVIPRQFTAISAVGHISTAKLISDIFSMSVGARLIGSLIQVTVPMNRTQVQLQPGDRVVIAAVSPPRRLGEGEFFTEEEILVMPIKWVLMEVGA